MATFFSHKITLYAVIGVLILGAISLLLQVRTNQQPTYVTTTLDTGTVEQVVAVSGIIRAENNIALGFQSPGTLARLLVRRGDEVTVGTLLAEQNLATIEADIKDAEANLARARADRLELLTGLTSERIDSINSTLALRQEALTQTTQLEAQRVQNARRTLLSAGLSVYSERSDEQAVPPIVTGTYTCDQTGRYTLFIFRSNSPSGNSVRVSGLETGTYNVSGDQPTAFGNCGLRLQTSPTSIYDQTTWYIDIPNQLSPQYVGNNNAYDLAKNQADSAVRLATRELELAEAEARSNQAPARSEAVTRANAAITQAEARLSRLLAEKSQRQIFAPFAGSITDTRALPGETVGTDPIVYLLARDAFELVARIPEIDIGKLVIGQSARATFDTRPSEPLSATIEYIALNETLIDGVAYYEARLRLPTIPDWLRSGLNADVDIIVESRHDTVKVPIRFIKNLQTDNPTATVKDLNRLIVTPVTVELIGNDGFVAVANLSAGTTLVAE